MVSAVDMLKIGFISPNVTIHMCVCVCDVGVCVCVWDVLSHLFFVLHTINQGRMWWEMNLTIHPFGLYDGLTVAAVLGDEFL
jgi:hypothetical protein